MEKRALEKARQIAFAKINNATKPASNTDGITVILNIYARPEYFREQVKTVRDQSVQPTEIWVWNNASDKPQYDWSKYCDRLVVSNYNWKFFGRFALGLMAQTKYVAFIDDDITPAPGWLENCLNTIQQDAYRGILGGRGLRLSVNGGGNDFECVGWNGSLFDTPQEVDLVGHSWFMEKRHLELMWREEPYSLDNGEDMHLSYMAQKYGHLKTFVPPHPLNDKSIWSAKPVRSQAKSKDAHGHSVAHKEAHNELRDRIVKDYRNRGWKLFYEQHSKQDTP